MKIAIFVDAFPCISETFILNQITGLIDAGHDVLIFSGARPDEMEFHPEIRQYELLKHTYYHNDKPSNKIIRVLEAVWLFLSNFSKNPKVILNSLNIFKYGRKALSLSLFYKTVLFINLGEFDILFCHFGSNGELAALFKEIGIKGKLVTMFHGYDIRSGITSGPGIFSKLLEYGDCFLSISSYNYSHLIEFGLNPKKIVYHPVGIDLNRYSLKTPNNGKDSGNVIILTISRLIEEKGLDFGIRAINHLVNERGYTNIRYQILGNGPLMGKYKKLVNQLNLNNNVYFFGSQQHEGVVSALRNANIFLLPSIAEALPVALMEALAVGLPVVATKVGSVHELVSDNESGYLIDPGNFMLISEKLEHLMNNPDIWDKMALIGHAHIEKSYNIEILNKKLEDIFLNLINNS